MSLRPDSERVAIQLAGHVGMTVRDSRRRRRWTLRELADRAGVSPAFIHAIEHGAAASIETYSALGTALGLVPVLDLVDPRLRKSHATAEDPVHAAMGEAIASRLTASGFTVSLDEPFQHYQFAGRADVLAWNAERSALLHVENRTRFPNVGETFGSYNAKRRYMPAVIAERLGPGGGFRSVTNVIVALWSAEVLRDLRRHGQSFGAVCPDSAEDFTAWWSGRVSADARATSSLVVFDPDSGGRSDRRRFVGFEEIGSIRPRYRDYADAAAQLRRTRGG